MTKDQLQRFNDRIENALKQSREWNEIAATLIAERDAAKPKPRDEKDPAVIAERAVAFLCSAEGQQAMRKAAANNAEFIEALKAARNIPWEKLHEPFTI